MTIRHQSSVILAGADFSVPGAIIAKVLKGGDDKAATAETLRDYADRVAWLGFDFGRDEPYHSLMLGKGPVALLKVLSGECKGMLRLKTGPAFLLNLVRNRELAGRDALAMFKRSVRLMLVELDDILEPCSILARAYGFHEDSNERQLFYGDSDADLVNSRWNRIRELFPGEEVPLRMVGDLRRLRLASLNLQFMLRTLHETLKSSDWDTEEFSINGLIKTVNWNKRSRTRSVRNSPGFFTTKDLAEALEHFIKFAGRV